MHDDTMSSSTPHDAELSADEQAISLLLDRVAAESHAEPDTGFEQRLIAAARPGVAGAIGAGSIETLSDDRATASGGGWRRAWWALPIAAAVAIGVVVTRPGPSAAPSSDGGSVAASGDPDGTGVGITGRGITGQGSTLALASLEADLDDFLFVDEFSKSRSVLTSSGIRVDGEPGNAGTAEPADALLFDLLSDIGGAL